MLAGPDVESTLKSQKEMPSVQIGDQIWTTENLNVAHFKNGDPILHAQTRYEWEKAGRDSVPAWCYYDNDSSNYRMGKLYNFHAVKDGRGLAPEGWRISTHDDWMTLLNKFGGEDKAGNFLMAVDGWDKEYFENKDSLGFGAIPNGYRDEYGFYDARGLLAFFWVRNTTQRGPIFVALGYIDSHVIVSDGGNYSGGHACRCVKIIEQKVMNSYSKYFLVSILISLGSCATRKEYEAYQYALRMNMTDSYEKFLSDYPESQYAPIVRDSVEMHEIKDWWYFTIRDSSVSRYTDFIKRYPDSRYVPLAEIKISELNEAQDYKDFEIKYSVESLQAFLISYPNSIHKVEVLTMLHDTIPKLIVGTWDIDSVRIGFESGDTLYNIYEALPWIKEYENKANGYFTFNNDKTFRGAFMTDSVTAGNWRISDGDSLVSLEVYDGETNSTAAEIEKLTNKELVLKTQFEHNGWQFVYLKRRED